MPMKTWACASFNEDKTIEFLSIQSAFIRAVEINVYLKFSMILLYEFFKNELSNCEHYENI